MDDTDKVLSFSLSSKALTVSMQIQNVFENLKYQILVSFVFFTSAPAGLRMSSNANIENALARQLDWLVFAFIHVRRQKLVQKSYLAISNRVLEAPKSN